MDRRGGGGILDIFLHYGENSFICNLTDGNTLNTP